MTIYLTATQIASELTERLATAEGTPSITGKKIRTLLAAGLFPVQQVGSVKKVELADVEALAARTRYIADPREIDDLVFRVSCIQMHESPVYTPDPIPQLIRRFAGVDYDNLYNLTVAETLAAFEGVWHVSRYVADWLCSERATLLATSKGYVAPEHVRTTTEWSAIDGSSRRMFHTDVASSAVQKVVGTGIWIDVPPGRESGVLVS